MFKLHRLEVSGFKSFVDSVTLDFSGGVTGIVGPNGCGKSNLSEAITWALGEQSAKSLRGDSMEDVIFNGSDSRRPLGMAEVSLTLLTDPSFPAAEDGHLTLSRRVFRSGESQYRLNGKVVRLKDFRDLLMDTGLGIRAYSVIEQGKIGMILSGKPQERRKLIEEAAGVTRYKARKRIAEVKLEEATANLLRLNDIVSEIERNLRSLRRQAGAAKRFQEKQGEFRTLLRAVLDGRWAALAERRTTSRTEVEAEEAREAELSAQLSRLASELGEERTAVDRFNDELAAKHRLLADTLALIEGRQNLIKGSRQTLDEIARQVATGDAASQNRHADLTEARSALDGFDLRRGTLATERQAAATEVEADDRAIAALEAEVKTADESLESLRSRLLQSLNEATSLRNQLHREQIQAEKGSYQKNRLGDQLDLWSTQIAESNSALGQAQNLVSSLDERAAGADARLTAAQATREEARERLTAERHRVRGLEDDINLARQRHQVLEEIAAAESERQQAWRDALAQAGVTSPSFLGERLKAPAGWERSVDFFLGELEDALVLDTAAEGLALSARLSETGLAGRLVVPTGESEILRSETPIDPAIVTSLASALGLAEDVARALPPAYLVGTREDAVRLARQHPAAAFLSRDRFWAQGGFLHVQGEKAQPGRLARLREVSDLAERIPVLEAERDMAILAVGQAEIATRDAEAQLEAVTRELAKLREELAGERAKLGTLEHRQHRLSVEHETLRSEREEVERELERVAQREGQVKSDLERAERRHGELESGFDARQIEVTELRARREALRAEAAGRRGQLGLLDERLAGHDREAARLRRQAEDAERQIVSWTDQARSLAQRRTELDGAVSRAEVELQEGLERQAGLESQLAGQQTLLEERRTGLRLAETQIQEVREGRDQIRGRLEEARIRRAELAQEAGHVAALFREEFHEEPQEEPGAPPENLAELEIDLARTKEQIEKIGPVNILAGDEFTEQEQRHEFLVAQRADVAKSVDSLKATIREINQASGDRFLETFREVNENFGKAFQALFRGGEAEMRLLDEEDLLESGIEIVARPPGKRLQNLMLLSGGEKALTAIALLFALFKTRPSPFCILDEVDAPLDDINTLRFVEVLKQMARDTQFLVVTHNKLTMEVASRLYGVTMEERGVSKLISVSMEEVSPEREAEAVSA
jgi:chromosome segregation protein